MKSSFCSSVKILFISIGVNLPLLTIAQTYYHPTSGLQNTYAGNCEANTCSGTYVDNGGTGANYSNGVNSYYRTFCPNISGRCIRLTFSSFALEPAGGSGCNDNLAIGNGPTQGSPIIWQGCGTSLPPVITSTDRSGCITVRFTSNLSVNAAGWVSNITCVPCAGAGPNGSLNNDCANAEFVCDNLQVITANSEGPGLKGDVCVSGCALSENYSNWYVLNVIQPGTLGLTIDPTPNAVDYDFSLYGPVSGGCGGLGTPIRCSFAANTGNTGLRTQSNDVSEGVIGDGWVSVANVAVGTYYLMVNQWSYVANSQFQLDFSGTAIIGLPAPGITSNSPLCGTQALQLVATPVPGAAYFWSGPGGWTSGLQNPSRNPPVAGTYSLYYIVNGCSSTTTTASVILNSTTATISPASATICSGQSVTLTASAGTGYLWSNSASTQSITVSPATTTTYNVVVTSAGGCTASASSTVTVASSLIASISPAVANICNGQNITLTASGGASYSWSNSATTASITVNPSSTTIYSVTVSSGNCSATTSRTVTVNTTPTATILPATVSICNGASTTLTAGGGTSYSWTNAATTASITVNPASTTTYTVTVTNASNCTSTISRTVTVNTNPTATILPATISICNGASTTLTASGGTSYSWSNAGTTASITVNPASTTTYTVTVTNASNCTATTSRTVTVNSNPIANILPATASICSGASTTLTASGGISYSWSNASTTASITVNPATTTIYTVTVTNASNCTSTTSRTVTVNTNPTATILPATVSICNGASTTLTAGGGTSYSWSNASTAASITVNPVVTTTYTVTVSNASNCTATTSRTVTVNSNPIASILPATVSICNGASTTLTASGGTSYSWSNASTTASITVNPAITTTYTVTVTNANNCTATTSRIVTVNSNPTASILPSTVSICNGASTTLTASGGTSYSWSNAATTASITVNPATMTTYTVTVTNGSNCTATTSRTVTVNANPTATILPATVSICNGVSTTLTASGGISYSWSNASTTASITVNPSITTTYTMTVTNASNCIATTSRTVTVNTNPTATILPATVLICNGSSATLTASGGTSYSWNNAATTANITVNPVTNTTYTVTVTNASSCTATSSKTVTVNPSLTATILPGAASICNGENITLTASGGTNYSWSNAATTASITVNPSVSTTYDVTVTDGGTCTATTSRTVTVNTNPTATILPATVSICNGGSATLTASGGTSYSWSNAALTTSITVNPAATTIYAVTVTDANSCSATDSKTVTVNANPTATILPATVSICNGSSATLTASGGTSYSWSSAATTASITVNPLITATYTVTVTNASSCTATSSKTVTVNPSLTATILPGAASICNGGDITLTASGGTNYSWSNAATTASITVNPSLSTTYDVTVTDGGTCSATTSRTVNVNTNPTATILPATVSICDGGSATLTASGGTSYSWSNTATTASITVNPAATTTYTVTVTDLNSCSATDSKTVTVNANPIVTILPATVSICNGSNATLAASGGTSYSWSTAATTANITVNPLTTATYTVTVTNASSCTATSSKTITVNPGLTATILPGAASICNGENITLTASGGTNYSWSNAATTASITVNPSVSTTYDVTVTDGGSCSATTSRTVTVNTNPTATILPTTVSICDGRSATLTASGGTSYSWNNAALTASITVNPTVSTTYAVTVTDVNSCTATDSKTVAVNANPIVTILPNTVSICSGANAILTANGGISYSWSNTALTASITVNPATTTTYTVTVTDANSCTATSSKTITVNPSLTATILPSTASICNGENITLTASGGTNYSWSNAATTVSITVNPSVSTTYDVTVTDGGTCSVTTSRTLTVNTNPTAAILPATVSICDGESATLTASGGISYSWSNTATTTSITVNPSTTTSYTVTVTNASNCTATTSRAVTVNTNPTATILPSTVSICDGSSATLTASGGISYSWSNAATTTSITVNPASTTTYSITVTDANSCSATDSKLITVNSNPTATILPATVSICDGSSATLTASGGISYSWSNAATTTSITVNPASTTTYSITVTDANSCSATDSKVITVNSNPTATILPATVSICDGSNATLTASGGTSYSWSNSALTPSTIVNPVSTTSYSVTVTDANNCSATLSRSVTVSPNLTVMIITSTPAICNGESAILTASGGTNYSWSNSATTDIITVSPSATTAFSVTVTDGNICSATATQTITVNPGAIASISPGSVSICDGESSTLTASGGISFSWSNSDLTPDITISPAVTTMYSVTAIDGNGCSATSSRIVTVNPNPVASISATTFSICNGLSAALTASGGTTYLWSTSETTDVITVSPILSTTYWVTVIDGNTCRTSISTTVYVNGNPSPSITPASSSVCSGASVTLTASGGSSFSWSNSTTGNSITETPFVTTTYTVTATDANGCSGTISSIVDVTQSISLTTTVTQVSCNGGSDGAIRIALTGGQPPFGFIWDNGALTKDILNVVAGNYSVIVSDNVGCGATISDIVSEPTAIDVSETHDNVKCNGGSDGWINVDVSGGIPGYLFSWDDGNTDQNRNNLFAGNYSVIVRDNNSCTSSKDIIISEPTLLSVTGIPVDVACSGESTGSIDITAVGGTQPYYYLWDDGSTADDRNNLNPSNYSVTVTDNNTCQADISITIGSASGIVIDETHSPVSCFGKADGTINVTVTGGNSPYFFLWNDGVSLQNRTNLSAGNYSLEVTDGNSCILNTSIISIVEPAELLISETHAPVSCSGYNDGNISIVASGGTPLYNYLWDDGTTTQNRSNLSGGNYLVTVTDNNLCSVSTNILISEPGALTVSSSITDPTCLWNADDGSILLDVTGGTSPYQFSWSNGGSTDNIKNLPPDDYTVTIADANGCTVPNSLTFTLSYQYDFSIDASPSVTIVLGKSTVLGYTLTGNAGVPSIIWSPSQSLDCDDCVAPIASPFQTTLYTVTANTGGCSASDTVTIRVQDDYEIVAPNVFSPNGDGVNDEFQAYGNLDAVDFFEVQVYNRWGELLFESNDPTFKWDGTYRGKKMQPGVYVFQIRSSAANKRSKVTKGSLTLIE